MRVVEGAWINAGRRRVLLVLRQMKPDRSFERSPRCELRVPSFERVSVPFLWRNRASEHASARDLSIQIDHEHAATPGVLLSAIPPALVLFLAKRLEQPAVGERAEGTGRCRRRVIDPSSSDGRNSGRERLRPGLDLPIQIRHKMVHGDLERLHARAELLVGAVLKEPDRRGAARVLGDAVDAVGAARNEETESLRLLLRHRTPIVHPHRRGAFEAVDLQRHQAFGGTARKYDADNQKDAELANLHNASGPDFRVKCNMTKRNLKRPSATTKRSLGTRRATALTTCTAARSSHRTRSIRSNVGHLEA